MTCQIIFGIRIEGDLKEAFDYYEDRTEGLRSDFILSVEAAIDAISRNPLQFQKIYSNKRKANIRRFPFGVFYTVKSDTILVLAITHLMRDPKEWKKRKK